MRDRQLSNPDISTLAHKEYCYLTTTGRVTGKRHEIEIWFSMENGVVFMLSGGRDRSDWVRNIRRNPDVTIRISDQVFDGRARVVEDVDEDELARRLLVEKYERRPGSLSNWRRRALPVAVDPA